MIDIDRLQPFYPGLLPDVPKQPPKVESELKSELPAAAAGTKNFERKRKTYMSDKLNTLFPEAAKIFAEVSDLRPKDGFVAADIDVCAKALDKGIMQKELQFFYGGEIKQFGEIMHHLGLDNSGVKFDDYLQSEECEN